MPGCAVLYCRVSTDEQARRNADNLPTQEKKCRDHCKREKLNVLRVFVDAGESGRTADRPQLHSMLDYCREHGGKVTHVIVQDLSRLSRNVGDQNLIFSRLSSLGIILQSVDEPNVSEGTATGKLSANMLGSLNQYYSDVLSERVRYRMREAVKNGRFLWRAPVGYLNAQKNGTKNLIQDAQRAPLIRKVFEMLATGNHSVEAVRKTITAMGLRTRADRVLSKQSFGQMLDNWAYAGIIKTNSRTDGELTVQGNFEAIVSEELFLTVQDVIHAHKTPVPHKRISEDFPLKGFIRCYKCDRPLTAGWAKGRSKKYARYWCFTPGCKGVGISREGLESHFVGVLAMLQPTAELLALLPDIAASNWEQRTERIASEQKQLTTHLNEQKLLNRKAIEAKLRGELSQDDFTVIKQSIEETTANIQQQLKALESEQSTLEDLMAEAKVSVVNLARTWSNAGINERRELQNTLFPEGLRFSPQLLLFEPGNKTLMASVSEMISELIREHPPKVKDGRGDRI